MAGYMSITSFVALLSLVPVTIWMFKKYPPGKAAILCFLGAMMFAPEIAFIKLPLMPELGKARMGMLAMLLAFVFVVPSRRRFHLEWWWYLTIPLGFASGYMIYKTNPETLVFGERVMDGLTFKDGMYLSVSLLLCNALVGFLAMKLVCDERDLRTWLVTLASGGLIYTAVILIELRFSPQTHRWVYGYHPHESFVQTMRYGGFRPTAFMAHGIATSMYMLGTAIAASACSRFNIRVWKLSGTQTLWVLLIAVILCKSTGVWFYALIAVPMVRWSSPKAMARLSIVLAILTALYPYLRVTGQFPVEGLLNTFDKFSHERMLSLKFRFDNEDLLLDHAIEKVWFGWGASYGRSRVYDMNGKDISITDGGWIIAMGNGGVLGLVEYMSVPIFAVLTVARRIPRIRDARARVIVAALNLYVAICWLDVLPNTAFNFLPEFLGSSLCGISYGLSQQKQRARPRRVPEPTQTAPPASPPPVAASGTS